MEYFHRWNFPKIDEMRDIVEENTHSKKIKGGCRSKFFAIKMIDFNWFDSEVFLKVDMLQHFLWITLYLQSFTKIHRRKAL